MKTSNGVQADICNTASGSSRSGDYLRYVLNVWIVLGTVLLVVSVVWLLSL